MVEHLDIDIHWRVWCVSLSCCKSELAQEAVFGRFDKVLLLETGRVAYYGEVASLRGSLSNLGFACPQGQLSWITEACSAEIQMLIHSYTLQLICDRIFRLLGRRNMVMLQERFPTTANYLHTAQNYTQLHHVATLEEYLCQSYSWMC